MNNKTHHSLQNLTDKDFEALLDALDKTALVSVTDNKGDIIYANSKFVSVAKYPVKDLIGQNHRILKSGHQSQKIFDELWATISSGKVWRGEIKNRAKDGSYYWVDTSIAPILDNTGKPERYISVRFLITDKKEIENNLEEQMLNLQKLNEAMVGREIKMIELKEKIAQLKQK